MQDNTPLIRAFTTMASTQSARYKLKNNWILDSGSDIHVRNTKDGQRLRDTPSQYKQLVAGKDV